jgi:hypothetical protein
MTDNNRHFVEPDAVDAAVDYLEAGFALVPIAPGTKGPSGKDAKGWNLREAVWEQNDLEYFVLRNVLGQLERDFEGKGMGLAHAYAQTMALDIDDWAPAEQWLAHRGVDLQALYDAPDAVQLLSGRTGRGKLIYRMPDLTPALPSKKPTGSGLELRCADARGLTLQDVLPPSIHPVTGRPYAWGGAGDWRRLPLIPPELLQAWVQLTAKAEKVADVARELPSLDVIRGRVFDARVPGPGDYNHWVQVGQAIHYDTEGSEEGLDLWDEWSQREGYKGRGPLEGRWAGFDLNHPTPVSTAGLIDGHAPVPADAFEDLGPLPDPTDAVEPTAEGRKLRFTMHPGSSIERTRAPIGYFVKGLLPRAELAVLYGASGSGKSFLMIDVALAIARGVPDWCGHRVKQARVAYVVTEGKRSFAKRLSAYREYHGVEIPEGFFVLHERTPRFNQPIGEKEDTKVLAQDILAQGGADLIIIDTLSQSIPGSDENSSETMSSIASRAGLLAARTGAMVLFVHHSGKNPALGARGHSSLRAACDVELEIEKKDGSLVLTTTKSKDDIEIEAKYFKLNSVNLETDEDGDIVSSCVLLEVPPPTPIERLTGTPALIADAVQANLTPGGNTADAELIISEVSARIPKPDGVDRRRSDVRTAIRRMTKLLTYNDGVITWNG